MAVQSTNQQQKGYPSSDTFVTVRESASSFISTLKDHHQRLMTEANLLDGLIDQLEKLFAFDKSNVVTASTIHLSASDEGVKNKVYILMGNRAEWTQRQLSETVGAHQSTISTVIKALIQEGKVVMVEAGAGPNPSTYGLASVYSKSV